jgi:chemotaxis protein methyltransferase CheR
LNPTIGAAELEAFRAGIARRMGLSFDESKSGQLAEVLRQRLEATGRSSERYLAQFEPAAPEPSREEIGALARSLTVGETYFFRNPDQFRAVSELVLPERVRLRSSAGERRLRILSAGCSSGEEAYSLAILARTVLPDRNFELSIRAVDVNPAALEKARRGHFSSWALRETPADAQRRWFRQEGRELVLDEAVRALVVFEARNLALEDPELWQRGSYDLVFCRNMLMYFTADGMQAVVERIADALVPGGYLFLGHAETLRGVSQRFALCHTHGTFYYQVKPNSASLPRPIREELPTRAPFEALPLPLVDASDGWVDAIRKASERIHALSRGPHGAQSPPPVAGPSWDLALALELLQKERYGDALHLVRAFPPESGRDPDVLLLQAVLLAHNAELTAAEETCHRLLGMDELNAGAHYVLALCREGAKDSRAALEHDQVAVYLAPTFAMPRLHLGLLARRSGDRETARRELSHALSLLQSEEPARLILFGGGFQREALLALCRAELGAVGGAR